MYKYVILSFFFRCAGKKLHRELMLNQYCELSDIVDRFIKECLHHSKLRHPNIVQLIGVHFADSTLPVPTIVMEYLPMTLTQCLDKYPKLPSHRERSILLDVASGLEYLHTQDPPIMHRDLTPNNVLLNQHMQAKISDLGQSKILNLANKQTTAPGNMCYMPPEALVTKPTYNTSIDVFSFGVLILHVATHQWPFRQTSQDPKTKQVMPPTEVEKRKVYIDKMDKDSPLHSIAVRCLNDDPTKRPSAENLVEEIRSSLPTQPFTNTLEMEIALQEEAAKTQVLETHIQEVDIHVRAMMEEINDILLTEFSSDTPTPSVPGAYQRLKDITSTSGAVLSSVGSPDLVVGYKSPLTSCKNNLTLMKCSPPNIASGSMDIIVRSPLSIHFTGTLVHTIEGMKSPWGVAAGRPGHVFVANSRGYKGVQLYSKTGELCGEYVESLHKWETSKEGKCYFPRGIAVAGEGCFLLADTWCHRIQKFKLSPDLKEAVFENAAGSEGSGENQFQVPVSVRVDKASGDVYVCDKDNHRIQVLDGQLQFKSNFGQSGNEPCDFTNPNDIDFDSRGNIYIADCGHYVIKVFDRNWRYLGAVGGEGRGQGTFSYITSVCIDRHDYLYVTDKNWNCVQVFNPNKEFAMQLQLPTIPGGKSSSQPLGITVDDDGFVYVSCSATNCVHIYK